MEYSQNQKAGQIMGFRPAGGTSFDFPCEHGYHCPVCEYELIRDGEYDERLECSEYNGFLWCSVCNQDYPTDLCVPDIKQATDVYLATVQQAIKLNQDASESN